MQFPVLDFGLVLGPSIMSLFRGAATNRIDLARDISCMPQCVYMYMYLHRLLEDVRVDGSDAVDGVRAHDGEVGHVDPLLRLLLHDGHATHPVRVLGETL